MSDTDTGPSSFGPKAEIEHHTEPVELSVNGAWVTGRAWARCSMEHELASPYAGRSPVPDAASAGLKRERWVAILGPEGCTVLHAAMSLYGPRHTIVESYAAPEEVFAALRALSGGEGYEAIRALSLCDLLETNVLFRGVLPRWEDREREVPPFEHFEAPALYPEVLSSLRAPLSDVGTELAGCLDLEEIEAAGVSLNRGDKHFNSDTSDTIRLRVVARGHHGPGRTRHRVAIDFSRGAISEGRLDGPDELGRLWPVPNGEPHLHLDHLWLCDPGLSIEDILRRESPGRRMGPLPVHRAEAIGSAFFDFGWARQFFADWLSQ